MANDLVSICVPVYNGEKHLRECLDSALAQTYSNTEILVSDDGSTDGSLAIVREYAAKDPRVKLHVSESNRGLVGNWNRCLELASGEWIKFLFQDDRLQPACVEKMLRLGKQRSGSLVVCKREFFMEQDTPQHLRDQYRFEPLSIAGLRLAKGEGLVGADHISNAAAQNISMNFIGEPPVTFFHKKLVERFGKYNASLAQICDLEFCLRAGTVTGIAYIPETLVSIRVHGGSTTSRNLQNHYYTMRHADPVMLVHELLYGERYAPFRESLTARNKLRLKKFFAVRTYEAYAAALEGPDKGRFDAIAAKFPHVNDMIPPSLSTRLVYWLVKLKRRLTA